jgi:hypothetical protein
MTPTRIFAMAIVALAGAAACGGSDSGGSAPAPAWDAFAFASALQGTWRNPCAQQPSHAGAVYWNSRYTFAGTALTHWDTAYTDPACATYAGNGHDVHSDFVVGAPVTAGFGAAQVTAFAVDMSLPPDTGHFILYMDPADRTRVYGLGRWETTPGLRPTTVDPAQAWVKQ